jgi:addiction module RelB/DinJ family antitoxin
MAATTIHINTNAELKAKAQAILDDLGLDMSTAVNIFLSQVVENETFPFGINSPAATHGKLPRSGLRGCLKGKVWMTDDFGAPLDEMREYME